jgi:hypothetical protein
MSVPRPGSDEYAAPFHAYVSRVAEVPDAIGLLTAQAEQFGAVLAPLNEAAAEYRYAPGKWSVKEMLGHLCDAERIFAYRLLRIGRGDGTPLAGFEEDDYVRSSGAHQRSLADLLDEWRSVRQSTATLVAGMPADAWSRSGTSNGHAITARALLYIIVGHVDHHLDVLASRYQIGTP